MTQWKKSARKKKSKQKLNLCCFFFVCYCSLCAGPNLITFSTAKYLCARAYDADHAKTVYNYYDERDLVSAWNAFSNARIIFLPTIDAATATAAAQRKEMQKEIEIIRLNSYLYSHTIIRSAVLHLCIPYLRLNSSTRIYLMANSEKIKEELAEKWIWKVIVWNSPFITLDLIHRFLTPFTVLLPKMPAFWRVPICIWFFFISIWLYELKHFIKTLLLLIIFFFTQKTEANKKSLNFFFIHIDLFIHFTSLPLSKWLQRYGLHLECE